MANTVFCYPCLLFHPEGGTADSTAWTTTGVTDMHHLSEKVKKHEQSKLHINSCLKLSVFGSVNIATQLDEGYRLAVRRHNDEVSKNRHILNRLIQCVKCCGVFELALRGKDEIEGSTNPGIFLELVDFVAQLELKYSMSILKLLPFSRAHQRLFKMTEKCSGTALRSPGLPS